MYHIFFIVWCYALCLLHQQLNRHENIKSIRTNRILVITSCDSRLAIPQQSQHRHRKSPALTTLPYKRTIMFTNY